MVSSCCCLIFASIVSLGTKRACQRQTRDGAVKFVLTLEFSGSNTASREFQKEFPTTRTYFSVAGSGIFIPACMRITLRGSIASTSAGVSRQSKRAGDRYRSIGTGEAQSTNRTRWYAAATRSKKAIMRTRSPRPRQKLCVPGMLGRQLAYLRLIGMKRGLNISNGCKSNVPEVSAEAAFVSDKPASGMNVGTC
eukprot:2700664-Pleurochrysis_carterae.AAC.4